MVAPPLASIAPVNVEIPVTFKVPVTATLSSNVKCPPAESIVKLPVEVSISLSSVIPI